MERNTRSKSRLSKNKRSTTSTKYVVVDDEESEQVSSHSNSSTPIKGGKRKANTTAGIKSTIDKALDESIPKNITQQVKRSREENHVIYNNSASPKKRNRTIVEWLNNPQTVNIIQCPACQTEVLITNINNHLDGYCKGGIIKDSACKKSGELLDEKLNMPLKSKRRKTSNIIAKNKEIIESSKSLNEININVRDLCNPRNILSGEKVLTKPSKNSQDTTASHSQNVISSNKTLKMISLDIDEDEDDLQRLSNKLAKPILNHSDSAEGIENLQQQEHSSNVKPALNEKIGNKRAKKCEDDENNCVEVKELCVKDSQHSIDMTNTTAVLEYVKGNTMHRNNGTHHMEKNSENNDVIINQDSEQSDPYYLVNFKLVLDTTLSNEEDMNLFNDVDHSIIKRFQDFQSAAQKLYIRLFQRKPGWFRCSKLDYPKIAEDLKPVLNNLVKTGFLDNEKKMSDLKEVLHLLSAGDLRDLAKALHVIGKSTQQKGQNKKWLVDSLIKHGGSQKTLFGNGSVLLLKRAKEVLGSCVRVSSDSKSVFSRLLLLFSMNIIPEDEDNKFNGQAQQLSTLMLVNMGKLVYPQYITTRQVPIFKDRDHMIKFAEAYQEKHEMSVALEVTGDLQLETAHSFYPKAAQCFKDVLSDLKKETFSSTLPIHFRCFTAEWVYTKMCYLGVEVLQKKRLYQEAVGQLELLLQQDIYCTDCRGLWWERLALNVHQHLKQPIKALQIIQKGLDDSHVRFGRRLALVQRAKKILSSASFKKKKIDEEDCEVNESLLVEPHPVESITISGKRSADLGVFITPEVTKSGQVKEDSMAYLGVEEYALYHYRQQGYDEGIHGETSTFTTLYGLLFWDIIFLDGIPDVFRGKFQMCPLDINYDTFYTKRKEIIDRRLKKIENCSAEDLIEMLEKSWVEHEGQICSGVSWERFDDVEQAKQFVSCIGGKVLSGVCKHFAQDMRHWHSGMPDLVVWNSSNLQYRIVEVKGPGDRLSTKQQIWLHELASFGATVEVCYVTAVGGKKLLNTQ